MTPRKRLSEPETDYDAWVSTQPSPPTESERVETVRESPKRWCPTHRRYEINPKGRLLCGAAWAELYKIEREMEAELMHPNLALIKLAENVAELVEEIRYGGVIAEPPTKPQRPMPPYPPNPPRPNVDRNSGKGGIELP